jgi:hypothetical protein
MLLDIAPGSVAVPTVNNTGTVLCHSDAVEHLTLDPAPPAGQDRVDMVICQARGADLDGGINNDFVFAIVKGTPYTPPYNGVRDDPPTPPGAARLARVGVVGGTVTPGNIDDFRPGGLSAGGQIAYRRSAEGWIIYTAGTWAQVGVEAWVGFIVPPSGRVTVSLTARFTADAAGSSGYLAWSMSPDASVGPNSDMAHIGNVDGGAMMTIEREWANLTPGAYVQGFLLGQITSGSTVSMNVGMPALIRVLAQ